MMASKHSWEGACSGIFLVTAIVSILGIFGYVSLHEKKAMIEHASGLPKGASHVEDVGSGWVEFTYKNQRFLYHNYSFANHKSECIVRIDNESANSASR